MSQEEQMKHSQIRIAIIIMIIFLISCQPAPVELTKPVTETKPVKLPTRELPALPTLTSGVSIQPTKTSRSPLPTATETSSVEYYTDIMEFDLLHSDFFTYQVLKGSLNSIQIEVDELAMWFEVSSPNTSIAFFRNDLVYEEVNISAKVLMEDTQGYVKLICQHDPAIGWYEFNIALDGTYNIKAAVIENSQVSYTMLYSGETSKTYKNGHENEFLANCSPDELHFDFNGSKGWALDVPDTVPHIPRGQVGFGVESAGGLPVRIGFDEITVDRSYY